MEHLELLPPRAVAQLLSVRPRTLDNWRCKGQGPNYVAYSNRQIRYRRADVEAFIASKLRVVPAAAAA